MTLTLLRRQLEQLGATDVQVFERAVVALAALDREAEKFGLIWVCALHLIQIDGVHWLRHPASLRFAGGLPPISAADARIVR